MSELRQKQVVNNKTERIVEQSKREKIGEVFEVLDGDSDGLISRGRADLVMLSQELVEVLTPLLQELEEMDTTLDKEEFMDAALRLY